METGQIVQHYPGYWLSTATSETTAPRLVPLAQTLLGIWYRGQRDINLDIDLDDIGHYRYRHRYWVTVGNCRY